MEVECIPVGSSKFVSHKSVGVVLVVMAGGDELVTLQIGVLYAIVTSVLLVVNVIFVPATKPFVATVLELAVPTKEVVPKFTSVTDIHSHLL
jgi:hypothetical protein